MNRFQQMVYALREVPKERLDTPPGVHNAFHKWWNHFVEAWLMISYSARISRPDFPTRDIGP